MSEFGPLTQREPGWTLVTTSNGPRGWHRVRTVGKLGSLKTLCGLTGRRITESQREIICCSACQAAEAKPS